MIKLMSYTIKMIKLMSYTIKMIKLMSYTLFMNYPSFIECSIVQKENYPLFIE